MSLLIGMLLVPCGSAHAGVTFTGLGFLPSATFSTARAVSADGSVVAGYSVPSTGTRAIRWTATGGMVDLGTLPGASLSFGRGISGDGAVVVGDSNTFNAVRWTAADGVVSLGSAGRALGASANGSVIVGWAGPTSAIAPFRWTAVDGLKLLDVTGSATAISADSMVIVGDTNPVVSTVLNQNGHAFRWTAAGGAVSIDEFAPGISNPGSASAVSADGSVVAGYHVSVNGFEAFRWTAAEGAVDLGDLPGGIFSSWAKAVSADGSTIVGIGNVPLSSSTGDPFIWNAVDGMRDLRSVLTSGGADLTGWTLNDASGISADGLTIVGTGIDPAAHTQAWIATVPEPGGLATLALVASAAFLRGSRRCWKWDDVPH